MKLKTKALGLTIGTWIAIYVAIWLSEAHPETFYKLLGIVATCAVGLVSYIVAYAVICFMSEDIFGIE